MVVPTKASRRPEMVTWWLLPASVVLVMHRKNIIGSGTMPAGTGGW